MQYDCLDVSNKPFYKHQKKIIPTTVGAFLGPKNYADADMALKLWWRCNYINYGNSHSGHYFSNYPMKY